MPKSRRGEKPYGTVLREKLPKEYGYLHGKSVNRCEGLQTPFCALECANCQGKSQKNAWPLEILTSWKSLVQVQYRPLDVSQV